MARWTPDPSFYPSPASAAEAPPETVAYVVTLNTGRNGDAAPDALTVLDVEAGSSTYGQIVGRLDMPNVGDELHHFGWNACSSALCPWAPHPHVERRYLLVPGLRSSRIHIVDVKDDPHAPKLTKIVEAEEIAGKAGYSRPHTIHCGPDGIYVSALGTPGGDAPGGIFLLDHESFAVKGKWEVDRGPQELSYDFWWHLNYGTVITSEWGTPKMVEDGLVGELLLGNQYGHKLHVWDLDKRTHVQEIDLGAEHQMVLELRPAHDPRKAWGFVGVVTSTADLSASVWLWTRADDGTVSAEKVITIPAEPAEADQLPRPAQALRRRAAADHRHRAHGRRHLAARLLLGHRRAQALRRLRPAQPARDRLGPPRRDRRPRAPSRLRAAQRRAADGRGLPRRAPRVPHKLALRVLGRAVLPRGHRRLARQARRRRGRQPAARPRRVRPLQRGAPAPGPPRRRRRLLGLVLLPGQVEPPVSGHPLWPWVLVVLLGAYHGLNPAMGWLFAVALGMQERDRRAVLRALPPIAIGHELSLALVAALVLGLGVLTDTSTLSLAAGVVLIAFGIFRFAKPRAHPRWTTLRVNSRELTWWSFLMSSAHGAGLMVAPVLLGLGASRAAADTGSLSHVQMVSGSLPASGLALLLHVAAMILVAGIVAVVVYEKLGVTILRRAWLNLDAVWAGTFVLAGVLTLVT